MKQKIELGESIGYNLGDSLSRNYWRSLHDDLLCHLRDKIRHNAWKNICIKIEYNIEDNIWKPIKESEL